MNHLSEKEISAIRLLYNNTKDLLKIKKMILFGSKARGDFEEYSDIDILVLTEKEKSPKDRRILSDVSADISIDNDVLLSCLYFNETDWETGNNINPLFKMNVEKEGIEIEL